MKQRKLTIAGGRAFAALLLLPVDAAQVNGGLTVILSLNLQALKEVAMPL